MELFLLGDGGVADDVESVLLLMKLKLGIGFSAADVERLAASDE